MTNIESKTTEEIIQILTELVKKNPNDMELGKKIREFYMTGGILTDKNWIEQKLKS